MPDTPKVHPSIVEALEAVLDPFKRFKKDPNHRWANQMLAALRPTMEAIAREAIELKNQERLLGNDHERVGDLLRSPAAIVEVVLQRPVEGK